MRRVLTLAEEFLEEGRYEWGLKAKYILLGPRALGKRNSRKRAARKGSTVSSQTTSSVLLCNKVMAGGDQMRQSWVQAEWKGLWECSGNQASQHQLGLD